MSDQSYNVLIRYTSTGSAAPPGIKIAIGQTEQLQSSARAARSSFDGLGSSIGSVGSALTLAAGGLLTGFGAAAFKAIKTGFMDMNAAIEETQIGLAGIFQSQGWADSLQESMIIASSSIAKMRKDAAALPGSFTELTDTFRTIAIGAAQAGLTVKQTRELAGLTSAVSHSVGLAPHVAAREMAGLLMGHAGHLNLLGQRLGGWVGSEAQKFNQETGEKHYERISEKLAGYKESFELYQHSFEGLFSTFKDHVKGVFQLMSAPLFGRAKASLEKINAWFSQNTHLWEKWGSQVGEMIGKAWDYGTDKIQLWGPAIKAFAQDAFSDLKDVWDKIGPIVKSVSNHLRESMLNGKLLDKLESTVKMLLALKIGGGILSAGSSAAGLVSGGSAAVGALGAGGAVAGLAGLTLAAVGAAAALGEMSALADATSPNHLEAAKAASRLSTQLDKLTTSDGVSRFQPRVLEPMGVAFTSATAEIIGGLNDLLNPLESLRVVLNRFDGLGDVFDKWYSDMFGGMGHHFKKTTEGGNGELLKTVDRESIRQARNAVPPNHTTHIHRVEINVLSNQDPSRIARVVGEHLQDINRRPKQASKGGFQNFSNKT